MKKIYLKRIKNFTGYWIGDDVLLSNNNELYTLNLILDPVQDSSAEIVNIVKKNTVYIFSWDSFKEPADIEFFSKEEKNAFEIAYKKYHDQRENEIPHIELSIQDWDILKEKWAQIKEEKPKYVIFELDDSGPLDKVDVYGKEELSEQDIEYIKQEHEKYLKYEKARQKYIQNHPDYSDVWRGPQDDEYEADIMQYYDDE